MINCEKCGKHTSKADINFVLTSYPPQYMCKCTECGHIQYILCHNYKIDEGELETNLPDNHQDNHQDKTNINIVNEKANQTITGEKTFILDNNMTSGIIVKESKDKVDLITNIDVNSTYIKVYTHCMICGTPIEEPIDKVCDSCKEAVKYVKEHFMK